MPNDYSGDNGTSNSTSTSSSTSLSSSTSTVRKHGCLIDAVDLTEYPFQFEPSSHTDEVSTHFGEKLVVGQRLASCHWVGGGKSDVDLDIYLVGGAYSNPDTPSSTEVNKTRNASLVSYHYWIQQEGTRTLADGSVISTNQDGSPVMVLVRNPDPPPTVDSSDTASSKITANKTAANKVVLDQINSFKGLLEPKTDLGAPHPVYISMGGLYTGIQFVIESLKVTYISRNLGTLVPYEASLRLKLIALGDASKYAGSGAKS